MNHSEALAKRVIEGVEPGARMVYREDQSIRTFDFDLHRTAAAVAAVEVTSVTDGVVKASYAAIDRCRRIPRRLCAKDWRIHPASDANIKRIAKKADAYLARIEASGIDRFFSSSDASRSPAVAAIWRDLRVNGGRVLTWHEPGNGIALPVTGGAVGVGLLTAVVDELASTPDNIEKLAASGTAERHLAIYVDHSATSVLMALRDFEAPDEAADLPAEITDVWIFSETYGTDQYVVWRAGVNRPWLRLLLARRPNEDRLVVVDEDEVPVAAPGNPAATRRSGA
jgi:hypothetical protein